MIVLDTHVWVWWVHSTAQLTPANLQSLDVASAGEILPRSTGEVLLLLSRTGMTIPVEARWGSKKK